MRRNHVTRLRAWLRCRRQERAALLRCVVARSTYMETDSNASQDGEPRKLVTVCNWRARGCGALSDRLITHLIISEPVSRRIALRMSRTVCSALSGAQSCLCLIVAHGNSARNGCVLFHGRVTPRIRTSPVNNKKTQMRLNWRPPCTSSSSPSWQRQRFRRLPCLPSRSRAPKGSTMMPQRRSACRTENDT